jgi:hypothetical protein
MRGSALVEIQNLEKQHALDRVLASHVFHRSDQLKSLLRYICEREIGGTGDDLDEYTVAVEALGRRRDYTAFEDGTVRNRVHHLRRRLDQYYAVESPADPVRIVLPKGSYCPEFQRNAVETPPALEVPTPPLPGFWERPVSVGAVCLLLLALTSLGLLLWTFSNRARSGPDPVVGEAWGPLLVRNANPMICIATSAQLALLQRPVAHWDRPSPAVPDLVEWYSSLRNLPPASRIYLGPSLTSPFWGDVTGALAAIQVLNTAGVTAEVLPEPSIQMGALNKRNVLLFGRPAFSRSIDLYLADKPFRIPIPDEQRGNVIWNVNPKPGEPKEFSNREASASNREVAFGLITVMPSWGDSKSKTVVFSGTLSPGTQAASEFFASPRHLNELLQRFRQEGITGFPASYQVVVRSTIFDTSALDVQYVAHRIVPAPGS